MPSSRAPSTASNRASSPASWPCVRFRPRWRAQRPLPSMTTATWRGMRAGSRSEGNTGRDRTAPGPLLDGDLDLHPRLSVAGDVAVEGVGARFGIPGLGHRLARVGDELLEGGVFLVQQ